MISFKDYLYYFFVLVLQFYKLSMGCFLTLFVPQKCGDEACTMLQLLDDNNTWFRICLAFNISTFLAFLFTFGFELERERWCLSLFTIDENTHPLGLVNTLCRRKDLDEKLRFYNKYYIISVRICSAICMLNGSSSFILVCTRYVDISTLTSFTSFILLLGAKLRYSYLVACESFEKNIPLSAFTKRPSSYNMLSGIFEVNQETASFIFRDEFAHVNQVLD